MPSSTPAPIGAAIDGCESSAPGEHLERVGELACAFGREIEAERLDGDEPAFDRVVRTEDETRRAGAHLMQDTERAKCGGG